MTGNNRVIFEMMPDGIWGDGLMVEAAPWGGLNLEIRGEYCGEPAQVGWALPREQAANLHAALTEFLTAEHAFDPD